MRRALMSLMFAAGLLTGCMTVNHSHTEDVPARPVPAKTAATVEMALELVTFQGTRVIFTKEQAESARMELVEALREFGVEAADAPASLEIKARLVLSDRGCETLFIESNCWLMLLAQPLTLYLLPTSYHTEAEVELKVARGGQAGREEKGSVRATTYVHLLFAPLVPVEFWRIKSATPRRNLYRELLGKALAPQPLASS